MLKKPFGYLMVFALLVAAPAFAQRRFGSPMRRGGFVFVGGYFYDPFFGPYPWWSPGAYPYGYFPQYDESADIRVDVKPKEAAVYVDGYYAGVVDDFDGFFQRLTVSPGPHDLTVYLEGFRTAHEQINLARRAEYKLHYQMERLPAGQVSEKPALAPALPPPPAGSYVSPRTPPRGGPFATAIPGPSGPPAGPPPAQAMSPGQGAASAGNIVFRVQPGGAEVLIDGERWTSSDNERLVVQLAAGRHHVEIRKSGYRPLTTDVDVRGGSSTPLNVSLSPE